MAGTERVPLSPYLAVAVGYAFLLAALHDAWTPTIVGLVVGAGGLTALVHADDWLTLRGLLSGGLEPDRTSATYELRLVVGDGGSRSVELSVLDLLDDPATAALVLTIRDIDRRKRLEAKLAQQAYHDALTGLPSNALFMGNVADALARSVGSGTPVALLYLDLDKFGPLNNRLGHAAGDASLVEAVHRIQRAVGTNGLVGRVGGDEFAVLVEVADDVGAVEASCERVLTEMRRPHMLAGRDAGLGVSIGLAVTTSRPELPDDLLRTAEAAMRLAKRRGKNRWARLERLRAA